MQSAQEGRANLLGLIQHLERQESNLILPELTNDTAFQIGSLIRSNFISKFDASKDGIVISISLFSGHTLFACAVGNPRKVGPDNWDWVKRKANTVKRFGQSSYRVGRTRVYKNKELDGLGPDYAAHGGGFPIWAKGMTAGPVGVIVVSGLAQEEDHNLVTGALEQWLRSQ